MNNFLLGRDPATWAARERFPSVLVPAEMFMQDASSGLDPFLGRADA